MSELLDELARALAGPMPRSRALRVLGGALVTAVVPAVRPGRLRAAVSLRPTTCGDPRTCANTNFPNVCGCDFLAGCYRDCCAADQICCTWSRGGGGPGPPCEKACCGKDERCGIAERSCICANSCGSKCCTQDEFCANQALQLCCKKGQEACGGVCCDPNEECLRARIGHDSQTLCVQRCPAGRARCGSSKCCPTNWRCANPSTGLCKRCAPNEEECERKCCNRKTSRCCGKAGCCPNNRSCCVTGAKQICCPRGQKCAVPILAGDIGVKPGEPAICCPPERYVPNPKICCPAGQVALTGPGMRVGPGLSPYCCPSGQTCGSGGGLTCCQKSDVLGSETCCAGKCVDLRFDPKNCASCGNVCTSGVCKNGVCAFP